jgi:hypothetical protein
MRRSRLLLCALALLALTAAPAAADERAGAAARGPASASLDECAPGTAVFEAAMDAVPGASRMSMKFVLQARRGRRFRRVDAAGFGTWTTSEPGVARYV